MRFKVAALHIAVITASLIFGTSANAATINLVGFGDSLMAGYQLPPGDGFPEKLQATLKAKGVDVSIANAGVSGDTTTGGLARIDWSVPDGTNGVILELGANDALRGIAPEESEKNLDAMIARLKESRHRRAARGHDGAAEHGWGLCCAFQSNLPKTLGKTSGSALPFFP